MGEFIPVRTRRRGRKGRNLVHDIELKLEDLELSSPNGLDPDTVIKRLQTAQDHLEMSEYFTNFKEQLKGSLCSIVDCNSVVRPKKVVCYGLGKFSECVIARYQLALLSSMKNVLDIHEDVELYDPMFSNQEIDVMKRLGFHVISENEEGKRSVQDYTLFYLPHCSHQLVNNLLYANWNKDQLSKCIILSNSFANIQHSVPPRQLSDSLSFVARGIEVCLELELKNSFDHQDIFNDSSFHVFPTTKCLEMTDNFWAERKTPEYKDCDFVTLEAFNNFKT